MSISCRICGKPATMSGGDFETEVCSFDHALVLAGFARAKPLTLMQRIWQSAAFSPNHPQFFWFLTLYTFLVLLALSNLWRKI